MNCTISVIYCRNAVYPPHCDVIEDGDRAEIGGAIRTRRIRGPQHKGGFRKRPSLIQPLGEVGRGQGLCRPEISPSHRPT